MNGEEKKGNDPTQMEKENKSRNADRRKRKRRQLLRSFRPRPQIRHISLNLKKSFTFCLSSSHKKSIPSPIFLLRSPARPRRSKERIPPLNRDHGYPLRVVVPGVIGARSVKWLEECQGFFMQKDYKMFPPTVNWENINWSTRRPQIYSVRNMFPRGCECGEEWKEFHILHQFDQVAKQISWSIKMIVPRVSSHMNSKRITIKEYAVSGGGRGIERVDVSVDGGKTWAEAFRYQKSGTSYIADGNASSDKWARVLFETKVDISRSVEIVAKAVDIAANVQPENVEYVWNLRGILNNSWHRVEHANIM